MINHWLNPRKLVEQETNGRGNWQHSDAPFPRSMLKALEEDLYIPIPSEILSVYQKWRPTSFRRVEGWERFLGSETPIYIKDEGDSLLGSYKLNTAIAHAFYAKCDEMEGLVGETLAGHWGLSMVFACKQFGLKALIVVHHSIAQEKKRFIELIAQLGGEVLICHEAGDALETSRAMALSLARERGWGYAVGCSFDHVLMHQSVIGNELIQQAEERNLKISGVISCCGSGSNLGGIALPILQHYQKNNLTLPVIYGGVSDPRALSSDMKAKGLTGHNLSRIMEANIRQNKIILQQISIAEAAQAARSFFAEEGILVAPESSYGLAAAERILKEHAKKEMTGILVICISGRGYWD